MTQISSQATRQAILVGDSSFDPDHPPANLALFAPDGTILNADTLKGEDGAIGPTGLPGINWRGVYSEEVDYLVNDGVFYEGSSWRALMPMIHPASEPSETGALQEVPFYGNAYSGPAISLDVPNTVIIPDEHTAIWRYFDLLTPGTITLTWASDIPAHVLVYDNAGENLSGLAASPYSLDMPAGRVWVDFQDNATQAPPNTVAITIALSNGASAAPGAPWALVAQKGDAGADGSDGADGIDGADGGPVPVGGTTGQLLAKVSDTDGDVVWEDPPAGGGSSGGGSGWVSVAGLPDDTVFGAGAEDIGPTLTFEVGASGMVVLHASGWFWHPPSQYNVDVLVDGGSITNGNGFSFNQGGATLASLTEAGLVISYMLNLPSVGAMLILAPGEHTVKFHHGATNAGGHAQRIRLAAQSVG